MTSARPRRPRTPKRRFFAAASHQAACFFSASPAISGGPSLQYPGYLASPMRKQPASPVHHHPCTNNQRLFAHRYPRAVTTSPSTPHQHRFPVPHAQYPVSSVLNHRQLPCSFQPSPDALENTLSRISLSLSSVGRYGTLLRALAPHDMRWRSNG